MLDKDEMMLDKVDVMRVVGLLKKCRDVYEKTGKETQYENSRARNEGAVEAFEHSIELLEIMLGKRE